MDKMIFINEVEGLENISLDEVEEVYRVLLTQKVARTKSIKRLNRRLLKKR
jgi:hypothetical protein